jgi:hypothetical protein
VKNQPAISFDESLFAVAERRADRVRALLVRKGARATVLEAREFAGADAGALLSWLNLKSCNDLRMMLPASAVIVRMTTLPSASSTQMLTALSLQAESFFLGTIPHHRLGLAILPEFAGRDREGIVIAWPPAHSVAEGNAQLEAITRYLPEPAALLPLATQDVPAVSSERRSGSIAIALRAAGGVVLRAAREDTGGDAWTEGIRRAVAETALNAGIETPRVAAVVAAAESNIEQTGDRALIVDPEIRRHIETQISVEVAAALSDASWWREWALLIGAALAANGGLSDLCRLRRHEAGAEPTALARLIVRYSSPARAVRVCVAAIAIAATVPLGAAWLRSFIYEWKLPASLGEFQVQQRDIERRLAHYEAVARKSLPVSKILGDLAVATPDGIELESIQMSPTQGISVRGTAKPQGSKQPDEIVNTMARLMDSSGVFRKTNWGWNAPDGRGEFKFSLSAEIARATLMPSYDPSRDWAVKTLAQRKYGDPDNGAPKVDDSSSQPDSAAGSSEGAVARSNGSDSSPTEVARNDEAAGGASGGEARGEADRDASSRVGRVAPPSTPLATTNDSAERAPGANDGPALPDRGIGRRPSSADGEQPRPVVTGGVGTGAGGGPGAASQANLAVPETVTDEQIAAMSKPELRAKLSEYAVAARRQELDAETRARLNADFNRILAALRSTSN